MAENIPKEHFFNKVGQVMKEQDRKKAHGLTVSEAMRLHNEDVAVIGMIVTLSQPFKMIAKSVTICKNENCSYKMNVNIYDKPHFSDDKKGKQTFCPNCNDIGTIEYEYVNAVCLKIQDDEAYGELEQLDVLVFDELTTNVRPGELVKITGRMEILKNSNKNTYGSLYPVLFAKGLEYRRREEQAVITKEVKSFESFAKMPNVVDRLVTMFAPDVIGHKDKKKHLLISAVGAPESTILRGRIHTLLIGPPGVAKSKLARAAVELVSNSRFVTAQNASGKGITAVIDKENDNTILRIGAAPQARDAICAINEIGRMDFQDQAFLLDVMEEGGFSVDKYGLHIRIRSPTTIIATSNPLNSEWNDHYKISYSEMPILKPLLDRFDQISAFDDFSSLEESRMYAQRKVELSKRNIDHNYNYLRKYLLHAKTINPILTPEAQSMLIEFWLELKSKNIAGNRTLDSLIRVAKAFARLRLTSTVGSEIIAEVMLHYQQTMMRYGQVVKLVESPRIVAFNEMLSVIKRTNSSIEFTECLGIACQNNQQIRDYVGKELKLRNNWRLRPILDMLVNSPNIKQVKEKPVVLLWVESTDVEITQHRKFECDVCEVCDEDKEKGSNDTTQTPDLDRHQSLLSSKSPLHINSDFVETEKENDDPVESIQKMANHKTPSHPSHTSHTQKLVKSRIESTFDCYYCNNFHTFAEDEYISHGVIRHPGKPMFPSKADIERHKLKSQGKSWETGTLARLHEDKPCPVCKKPGQRRVVELQPNYGELWRVVHDDGTIHEWDEYDSVGSLYKSRGQADEDVICPVCQELGQIVTYRKDKIHKPFKYDYKISHGNKKQCMMVQEEHRNIILKYLGRYVEQEPEATTKATTKEIEKPQSAAAKTTTTIGGRRKRTRITCTVCFKPGAIRYINAKTKLT